MDGGQPSAATDLVEWRLYLDGASEPSEDALRGVLAACTAQVAPLLRGYIWQRDPFTLRILGDERGDGPRCLGGAAHVGESLEDEWLLAWLCFQLTRAVAGLTARVWDSDGEFLLIEAAYSLQKWARRPEATDNRVFIRGGQLRMLSPAVCPGEGCSLPRGLQAVTSLPDEQTMAPAAVRQCIDTAMKGFPERCGANMHTTRCRLPARVAALLRAEPQLVAPAVVMFHERDPSDVAAAARMACFPYTEVATVAVRFTRMLFAQLAQQEFHPPRNAPPVPPESHPGHGAAVLGVKLTAGFEMLAAQWSREGMPLPGPGHTTGVGSDAAGTAFGEADNDVALARRAAAILRACPDPAATEFGPDPGPAADDSDEWLSQGEALLDHALRLRDEERTGGAAAASGQGGGGGGSEPEVAAAARQVDAAVRGVRAFLAAQGGVDGVSVPTGGSGHLSVDPSSFLRELSQALGVAVDGLADGEGRSSDEDDLSDDDDDVDSDVSDDEQMHAAAAGGEARGQPQGESTRWRVVEGPDSDDEEEEEDDDDASSDSDGDAGAQRSRRGFHAQYAAVLQQQLRETALGEDFAHSGEGVHGAPQLPPAADLPPLDVDLNLVQSLLASYAAQGGHPGPASNMLAMLGLGMPDTADLSARKPRRAEQTDGASEE